MENHAKDQASAQYSSLVSFVTALNVDFDRLEYLQEIVDSVDSDDLLSVELAEAAKDELAELLEDAAGYTSGDAVRDAIQEDPLSVEIRSDWHSVGESLEASEFRILLCTGGPAVQIRGELDEYKTPCRAWIEYQDWGMPWTQFFDASQETLLTYCQQFYFGE